MGAIKHQRAAQRILRASSGFTLVELMIVVAVIAILAVIAYPAYNDSIRKARRSEAIAALGAIHQAQERHRSNNTTYAASLAALPAPKPAATTPGGYYDIAVTSGTATGYTATATAQGSQAKDSNCTPLMVVADKGDISYTPDGCWRK